MANVKQKPKDKMAAIRSRVADAFKNYAQDIEDNKFIHVGAGVFEEMQFLLNKLDEKGPVSEDAEEQEPEE